jgi:aspartate aminotransferase-like enzyme
MGVEPLVSNPADRMVTVTGIKVPAGVDEARIRRQLLEEFNIEVAGGFGPLKGKIIRVGLLGYTSIRNNVLLFLAAFEKVLLDQGCQVPAGAGVGAAVRSYAQAESVPAGSRK